MFHCRFYVILYNDSWRNLFPTCLLLHENECGNTIGQHTKGNRYLQGYNLKHSSILKQGWSFWNKSLVLVQLVYIPGVTKSHENIQTRSRSYQTFFFAFITYRKKLLIVKWPSLTAKKKKRRKKSLVGSTPVKMWSLFVVLKNWIEKVDLYNINDF